MIQITALSILILGLVAANLEFGQGYHLQWEKMTTLDAQHVGNILHSKHPGVPQIERIEEGMKKAVDGGNHFLMLYETQRGDRCCGQLVDTVYKTDYRYKCNPNPRCPFY